MTIRVSTMPRLYDRVFIVAWSEHHRAVRTQVPSASQKCRSRSMPRSTAGHEGHDDVGGVAVEVLPSPVVDGRGAGIGVTSGDLDVSQRDTGVKGGHD
jgi:hypothetical protein